jgi:hypothetical protein
MNGRPLTDAQISQALRAHLPDRAQRGLGDRILELADATLQQRPLPSFLGALSDADPVSRRRSLLIAAALLVAVAVASVAAVGALRLLDRDPIQDLSFEPPADVQEYVQFSYDRLPELPPLALTWHDSGSAKGRVYVHRSGAVRFDRFTSAESTEPSSYTVLSDHRVSGMATVGSDKVWVEQGGEAIGEDPRVFIQTVLNAGEGPGCEMERDRSEVGNGTAATGWRYVGVEEVAGRPTHHVACVGDLWIDIETRLILRMREPETDDAGQPIPGQYGTTEVTEIAFGEQPAALFEAPEGVAHMTSEAYSAYLCTRDVRTEVEVGFGTRECIQPEQPEPPPEPSPTPDVRPSPLPSDCAGQSPDPSGQTGPLTWTEASLKADWPAPVRAEPDGDALVVPWPETFLEEGQRLHQHTDPSGDTGSACFPWVDIQGLAGPGGFGLASNQIPAVHPTEQWVAYGVVFDVDRDGVPDWRYGIDNMPVTATGELPHRAWVTDLHTGRTESAAGPPYGVVGKADFDTWYERGYGVKWSIFGPGRPGQIPTSIDERATDVLFYAWASVIQDGRVVATDYAPDLGWLDPTVLGPGQRDERPFGAGGNGHSVCVVPPQPGCRETDSADNVQITFALPDGWAWNDSDNRADVRGHALTPHDGLFNKATGMVAPQGMRLQFLRGGWLFSDPCRKVDAVPDIRVGPSASDFVDALAAHPLLDVTTPVPVTLGGYSGKYLDLQVPSNIADCTFGYHPWAPSYYAPGPNHQWHIWSLNVDGVRVVIMSEDFPGTSAQDLAEMRAITESIQINP